MVGFYPDRQKILNQIRDELRADAEAARPVFVRAGPGREPVSPFQHERGPTLFARWGAGRRPITPIRSRAKPCTVAEVAELRAVVQAARQSRTMGRLHWLECRTFTDAQLYHIYRLGMMTHAEVICVRNNVRDAWGDFDDAEIISWLESLPAVELQALLRQGLLSFARMPMIQLQRYLAAMPIAY